MKRIALLAASLLLVPGFASAQVGFPPAPPKVSPAAGMIDMHVHSHPDVFPTSSSRCRCRRSG